MPGTLDTLRIVAVAALSRPKLASLIKCRVGLLDCDFNRHLTNSKYSRFMDLGRWDLFMRSRAFGVCWRHKIRPLVVDLNIQFKRELPFNIVFDLDSRMIGIDGKALVVEQTFLVGGQVHAQGTVRSLLVGAGGVTSADPLLPFLVESWTDSSAS